MNKELQELLKQEWYTQGFAARPLFLCGAGTIKYMHKDLGFSYKNFLTLYKEDYCKYNYPEKDMEEIAEVILEKLKENPKYLEEKRQLCDENFESRVKILQSVERAPEMSEQELFDTLLMAKISLEISVGGAHLIESLTFRLEEEIRKILKRKSSGKELNKDFSVITSPTTLSFISKKEALLWIIKKAGKEDREKLMQEFISKFFWVGCNYVGCKPLKPKEILEEASSLEAYRQPDFEKIKREKQALFEKYGFSEEEKRFIAITEFMIDWQDERKERIFRCIYSMDKAVQEISKRFKIEPKTLQYILAEEMASETRNGTAKKTGEERIKGCVIVKSIEGNKIFGLKEFKEVEKAMNENHEEIEIITGQCASIGTASGPVKICTTLESLQKVEQGDILVASMTRPEYISAMKKAAAIVTDEGGVLCHAAIVSRELGIPCVVGTRIATKVLEDRELVEVRASHGMVRKIKGDK